MKVKTVRELIIELEQYKDSSPVIFRTGKGDGYFSDSLLSGPHDFYPHEAVYFTVGEQIENDEKSER